MIDLTDAVQKAVFDALASVTAAPVYSVVPEGTQPPYIVIGDDTVDPTIGCKDGILESHTLRIVTVFAGASKRALSTAMNQVRTALVDAPLTFAGANLSSPVIVSSDDRVDPQSGEFVGEQSFLIFAQPGE
jgi:hypothetical protein